LPGRKKSSVQVTLTDSQGGNMQHSSHCVEMALLLHIVCIFTANVLQRYCKGVAASLQK
jgi:hypothetical protein